MFVGIAFINAMLVNTVRFGHASRRGPSPFCPTAYHFCARIAFGRTRLMVNVQLDATSRRPSMDNHEYHGKQSLSHSREVLFMPR